jgi:hypothetical protein
MLPKGLVKVRYYGLLSVGKRRLLAEVRSVLALGQAVPHHLSIVVPVHS